MIAYIMDLKFFIQIISPNDKKQSHWIKIWKHILLTVLSNFVPFAQFIAYAIYRRAVLPSVELGSVVPWTQKYSLVLMPVLENLTDLP